MGEPSSPTLELGICRESGKQGGFLMLSPEGLAVILLLHCWPVGI